MKFESSGSSWKVTDEVGKLQINLERINEVGKVNISGINPKI